MSINIRLNSLEKANSTMGSNNNTLKNHIGYWLNRLRAEVHHSFEERLSQYDISIAAWCILVAIYDKKQSSINQLANYIQVDKASVSRLVDKLVTKNLLVHKQGKDRRSGMIELTEAGKILVPKLIKKAEENELVFFSHLNEKDKTDLKRILTKILVNLPGVTLEGWLTKNK